ncbi:MAG: Gx transporter family protein [Christensenellaceae bacterium]
MKAKKVASLSLLTALALVAFMVENLFPPILIPGARLGISNVVVMLTLIYFGLGEALVVVAAKCLLSCMFGGFLQLAYNLPSGVVAVGCMFLLMKLENNLSILSISAASAVLHNLVQNLVFCFMTQSVAVLYYAPYLTLLGMISGLFTGFATYLIIKYVAPKIIKIQINNDKEKI